MMIVAICSSCGKKYIYVREFKNAQCLDTHCRGVLKRIEQ